MWTLSTSVVPSGWFAGVFSVFRDGVLSFSVSVLWSVSQSLSCATGEHCWTMLTSEVM